MKKLTILIALAFIFVGCNLNSDLFSVAGNTYEKIYDDESIWELDFSMDSLHTYWKGNIEVSATFVQKGTVVECVSTTNNHFTIKAGKDYVVYSDNTFTLRK